MDWGKVIFTFFALMSLTTTAGFLYDNSAVALFIAASINLISTLLKVGVRNLLAAELFASSLVADLHLIPAFCLLIMGYSQVIVHTLVIGAILANVFSMILILIEANKTRDEF